MATEATEKIYLDTDLPHEITVLPISRGEHWRTRFKEKDKIYVDPVNPVKSLNRRLTLIYADFFHQVEHQEPRRTQIYPVR